MIKYFQILLLSLLLVGTQKTAGQILYTDIIPDTVVSCYPLNVNDSVFVDVNQDGQNDFVIISYTWFMFVHQNCCWCYRNDIRGLAPLNKVAQDTTLGNLNCSRIYLDSGICVDADYPYQNLAAFSGEGPCGLCEPQANFPKYCPFQMEINSNLCYGWFRLSVTGVSITLYDMAINLTPNACITTGQTVTGVTELYNESESTLFPNPFESELKLETANNEPSEIFIYDITLRKFIYQKFTNSVTLNTEQLAKGIYIFKVRNKNGVIKTGKVVKE